MIKGWRELRGGESDRAFVIEHVEGWEGSQAADDDIWQRLCETPEGWRETPRGWEQERKGGKVRDWRKDNKGGRWEQRKRENRCKKKIAESKIWGIQKNQRTGGNVSESTMNPSIKDHIRTVSDDLSFLLSSFDLSITDTVHWKVLFSLWTQQKVNTWTVKVSRTQTPNISLNLFC